jgi:hypothetical protein
MTISPNKIQGQLAKIKTEIQQIISYTDLTITKFLTGKGAVKNIAAARYTLHVQALRLLRQVDMLAELERED